jgi:hypothetical protein
MSGESALIYDAPSGKLRFSWMQGARDIEVYSLTETGRAERRLGFLTSRDWTDLNQLVDFEQEAFAQHCRRFLEVATTAGIQDFPETDERRPPASGE